MFHRKIKKALGSESFPYLAVLEGGERGPEREHIHMFLARVDTSAIDRAWKHGGVTIFDVPLIEHRRRGAAYISKSFGGIRPVGRQRYWCAQGFQPEETRIPAYSLEDGCAVATNHFGREYDEIWSPQLGEDFPISMRRMYWNDQLDHCTNLNDTGGRYPWDEAR